MTKNKIEGGKADKITTLDALYDYWADKGYKSGGISKSLKKQLQQQIQKGVKIEMEHTNDEEKATEITMDHLTEFPDYYDRLEKMENKAEKDLKTNESTKELVKHLIRENLKKKTVVELINDFGMLVSLNFSQITKMGKDEMATNELVDMMKNLRKPIINNMTYFELIKDIEPIINNPKFLSAFLNKIREFLMYIKPRIERFVIDNEYKTKWLEKINHLSELYRIVIA